MKRGIALAGAMGTAFIFVIVMIVGWSVGRGMGAASAPPRVQLAATTATPHYYLTIDTPNMLASDVGPAYVPSAFTLPANTDVTITIVNFDDATALPAQFAQATGIEGALSIQTLDPQLPNAAGTTHAATSLDPATGVSHTFTIPKLGLNVPVAPKSITTFTFHTGAAGTYDWHCYDPCGTGPGGWGGAMSAPGYMFGTVTFA